MIVSSVTSRGNPACNEQENASENSNMYSMSGKRENTISFTSGGNGAQAHGFVDACCEIGQLSNLIIGRQGSCRVACSGLVKFLSQSLQCLGVFDKVHQCDRNCRRRSL